MKTFSYTRKIYYHDTDCGDVVYYANYLKFCEEARDEIFSASGYDLRKLNQTGTWFIVGAATAEYRAPARFNDEVTVTTSVGKTGAASIDFVHELFRGETMLCRCTAKVICVDPLFKPIKIPQDIRDVFTAE